MTSQASCNLSLESMRSIDKWPLPAHYTLHGPPTPPGEYDYWTKEPNPFATPRLPTYEEREPVAIIGVGYVGMHLVQSFAASYPILAYDISHARLESLRQQTSLYPSVTLTSDASGLRSAAYFLIAVPTNVLPDGTVDTSNLVAAIKTVETHARRGSTVVIESSVAVGMTRQLLGPLAKDRGIMAGMSPERVDPGRTEPPARTIPKVISGLDDICPGSLQSIKELYSNAFDSVISVSKPEAAEMMKLYENCQRMIGIAYANEMSDACIAHGIDPYEVASAAATKPFGYLPFTPGLGVGGPCIPVNPYYLFANNTLPLLANATRYMKQRPERVASRLMARFKGETANRRVLVVGVGFKAGQSHLANSPAIALIEALQNIHEADVSFADPLVAQEALPGVRKLDERTEWHQEHLESFDLIVLAVKQEGLRLDQLNGLSVEVERFFS